MKTATSAGQYNLSMSGLASFVIPLAPYREIIKISELVDNLNSVTESTSSSGPSNVLSANRLRQSILKWALEGKLVDQDPNDEPASVLLERIRAERAGVSESPRAARGRKKKSS